MCGSEKVVSEGSIWKVTLYLSTKVKLLSDLDFANPIHQFRHAIEQKAARKGWSQKIISVPAIYMTITL